IPPSIRSVLDGAPLVARHTDADPHALSWRFQRTWRLLGGHSETFTLRTSGMTERSADDMPARDLDPLRDPAGSGASAVLTLRIAEGGGYTSFTQYRGEEEAARVAADFAKLARDRVVGGGGELIELRGDEALCTFSSARQAVRAAVGLQMAFRQRA